jgi:hypothetical protein
MKINKIIGYFLLTAGLIIIFATIFQSYAIFTGKKTAPLVFQTSSLQEINESQNSSVEIQAQIEQIVQKRINQILPPATITKILNLFSWSMLALILIWSGTALSTIGIKMIKS